MNYWLVKTEPSTWSWADQLKAKAGETAWTGVKNPQAQINLRAMKKGDRVFFYHTGDQKQIVGMAEVTKAAYPDPTAPAGREGKLVCVDLKAVRPLAAPVTLAAVKKTPRLANLALVKNSRLSVMPIDEASWKLICTMADTSV